MQKTIKLALGLLALIVLYTANSKEQPEYKNIPSPPHKEGYTPKSYNFETGQYEYIKRTN